MADRTVYVNNVPMLMHDNGDGTFSMGTYGGAAGGGSDATAANQALEVASLSVMDDWDETDRAKVNVIVGQAGIAAGAGAVGVTVPRVTLASDDPAVAHLANIVTAVQLIDNAISGAGYNITQLGGVNVSMNAGVVGTGVQRVTIATDDAAITALQLIDNMISGSGVNVTQMNGVNVSMGSGVVGTGVQRISIATDDAAITALQLIDNIVSGSGVNVSQINGVTPLMGNGVTGTGSLRVTIASDNTANSNPFLVALASVTGNGADMVQNLDVDESEDAVKTSPGTLYGFYAVNRASTPMYLKFYNATVANVTVGSTTPLLTLPLPGSAANYIGAVMFGDMGLKFDTAITIAATTGFAVADTGAPATNDVIVNVFYK